MTLKNTKKQRRSNFNSHSVSESNTRSWIATFRCRYPLVVFIAYKLSERCTDIKWRLCSVVSWNGRKCGIWYFLHIYYLSLLKVEYMWTNKKFDYERLVKSGISVVSCNSRTVRNENATLEKGGKIVRVRLCIICEGAFEINFFKLLIKQVFELCNMYRLAGITNKISKIDTQKYRYCR